MVCKQRKYIIIGICISTPHPRMTIPHFQEKKQIHEDDFLRFQKHMPLDKRESVLGRILF